MYILRLERLTPLFFYAERRIHGNQSKTLTGLILLHRIRKRDKRRERIIVTDVHSGTSYYIVWLLKNQKRDRDANSKGTMLLLRVQLIEYHRKYMQIGDIPSYAYENFCEMYEAYHALGGNGMITKMKQEIDELHIKRKDG